MTAQNNLEIKGKLLEHPLAELLAEAAAANLSGSFRLTNDTQKIIVYLNSGKPVFAASNARRHRLFEMLLKDGRILQGQLADIPNFSNDLELREALRARDILTEEQLDESFTRQLGEILKTGFDWRDAGSDGEWTFSPLMRVKEGVHFHIDIQKMLLDYARSLSTEAIVRRFKSFHETFGANPAAGAFAVELLPQEAFLLSRFEKSFLKVEEIKILSGLSDAATLQTLYALWLAGFLFRQNWNPAFTEKKISEINSAKLSLKRREAETDVPAKAGAPGAPAGGSEKNAPPKVAITKPAAAAVAAAGLPQHPVMPEAPREISLADYLERAENSVSFYEFLDIAPEAGLSDVKRSYFALAKRFHPDRFHQEKDADLLQRIQNAFTKAAQAYETLKDDETRKAYDYKLSKHLAALKEKQHSAAADVGGSAAPAGSLRVNQAEMARESFDQGFNLLMEDEYDEALPFLARAVQLVPDNARYHAFYGKALSIDETQRFKADAEMQTAVRLDPQNPTYRIILAEFYIQFELFRRAEGELQRLLAIHPGHAEALALLQSLSK